MASFTLIATMLSHADGQVLARVDFDITPTPITTVDSIENTVRSGGKRVTTDDSGKFTVSLATGENLYYTVSRAFGSIPFAPITFKAPVNAGGTLYLADVAQIPAPPTGGGGGMGTARGISSLKNDPDDLSNLVITYTDGSTETVAIPAGTGAVDLVNGQSGTVVLDAEAVGALPDTYTPSVADVTGLQAALDDKQDTIPTFADPAAVLAAYNSGLIVEGQIVMVENP